MLHIINNTRPSFFSKAKKFVFAAALLMIVGISSSFAAPTEVLNNQVQRAFQKDFSKAELLGYTVSKDYSRLTVKMNDVVLYAFYTEEGNLLAVTRNIKSSQLPVQLLLDLKKNFGAYWISDLFELTSDDQNNYYITLENASIKVTLKSTGNNTWDRYETKTKE